MRRGKTQDDATEWPCIGRGSSSRDAFSQQIGIAVDRPVDDSGARGRCFAYREVGMDAADRAARIVRRVVETLKPGFAVRLWT
ncbi:MAG: hypothetical protein E5X98_25380, partial [Mesorhizobium sp.]